jgi:hypothetical protein
MYGYVTRYTLLTIKAVLKTCKYCSLVWSLFLRVLAAINQAKQLHDT